MTAMRTMRTMRAMKVTELAIPGVKVFSPEAFADERGHFFESFRASWLPAFNFVQDNQSHSMQDVLRGLHYQLERPQGKLVRVAAGAVFDVAVDIRRSSPHFGRWVGRQLTAENRELLWVPPGFAHGFLTLSSTADVLYKCTDYYAPGDEYGIRWDDPALAISWPLQGREPLVSPKDGQAPLLQDAKRLFA